MKLNKKERLDLEMFILNLLDAKELESKECLSTLIEDVYCEIDKGFSKYADSRNIDFLII